MNDRLNCKHIAHLLSFLPAQLLGPSASLADTHVAAISWRAQLSLRLDRSSTRSAAEQIVEQRALVQCVEQEKLRAYRLRKAMRDEAKIEERESC